MAEAEHELAYWAKEGLIQRLKEENTMQADEIKRQIEMIGMLSIINDMLGEFIQTKGMQEQFQAFVEQWGKNIGDEEIVVNQ